MTTSMDPDFLQYSDCALDKALVVAKSPFAEGWEWNFFYEDEPGLYRVFVKSPFCPEGEYELVSAGDLEVIRGIPLITFYNLENASDDEELMSKSMNLLFQLSGVTLSW
jgi:hypothetical protein